MNTGWDVACGIDPDEEAGVLAEMSDAVLASVKESLFLDGSEDVLLVVAWVLSERVARVAVRRALAAQWARLAGRAQRVPQPFRAQGPAIST